MDIARHYKQFALLLFPPDPVRTGDPSQYERLAIPYTFKPRISLFEATLSVAAALTRIVLGSLLFAFWGTFTWMTGASIGNPVLRVVVVAPMILLFFIFLAVLMIGIGYVLRRLLTFRQLS